ncbi:hypothetical protein ACHAWO_001693 [Cyclotella atomus]|uniref:Uncharacterized protein n=1 Tax=Cyclotella atomus TaxID=382360 RepID=A0ABD3PNR0_9STRA
MKINPPKSATHYSNSTDEQLSSELCFCLPVGTDIRSERGSNELKRPSNQREEVYSHMRSENKKIQKTSTTQQARMDAMAARSLKKKRDLKNAISSLINNAIKCLHRTEHKKTSFHQMPVCICCDNFIIEYGKGPSIGKENTEKYESSLGVESYEKFLQQKDAPFVDKTIQSERLFQYAVVAEGQ